MARVLRARGRGSDAARPPRARPGRCALSLVLQDGGRTARAHGEDKEALATDPYGQAGEVEKEQEKGHYKGDKTETKNE